MLSPLDDLQPSAADGPLALLRGSRKLRSKFLDARSVQGLGLGLGLGSGSGLGADHWLGLILTLTLTLTLILSSGQWPALRGMRRLLAAGGQG